MYHFLIYCRMILHTHFDTITKQSHYRRICIVVYDLHIDTTLHEILLTPTATE